MSKIPIVIDTDPGVDDTMALIMSFACDSFDIKAITTVGGNVDLKHTSQNAKNVAKLCGSTVGVAKGAERPLYKELITASHIHGINGMGGIELAPSDADFLEKDAVDVLYETAVACGGDLRVLTLGPMTNVAAALLKYPDLADRIHSLVFMGGAMGVGNVTPAAEYNIYADPDAARIVINSGIHVTMVGLNVTVPTVVSVEDNKKIKAIDNPIAKVAAELNDYALSKESPFNDKGAIMHDPLAASVYMNPSVVKTEFYHVEVDCSEGMSRGATFVDKYGLTGKAPNVHVAVEANNEKFMALLFEAMDYYISKP